MPSPCPNRAELDSFQAGGLDETVLATIASHVESCQKCQKQLETIIGDSADTVLQALLSEPAPSPFAGEATCRNAIERVAALAVGISFAGKSVAGTKSPTVNFEGRAEIAVDDPLPHESIREYQLLAKLGEGGMGAVYKALHTRLDKVVALKVLPPGRMKDSGSVARFQREMKAVGRLDHPNIVRAMDAGEEDGTHFLVMEYVEGADLSQLAKNFGPLPIADACELVRQAALGLQEAHEHGMVHRDIKPSNLILAKPARKKSPPTLKILDLGLALLGEALAADQGLTSTGQMMGTIDYMAPEQGSDTHNVDIRADIYSLGATLYRLLTGTAPFAGEKFDTPVKKILALATKEPAAVQTLRADVSPELVAIVHKMLAKDPAQRFATPEELAEALAPFCQGANLAALLERGAENRHPSTAISEAPTHAQQSSPSADTAPTMDPRSAKVSAKPPAKKPSASTAFGRKFPRGAAVAAACGGLAMMVLLGVVFYLETTKGTIRIEINDPDIKVVLDEQGATFEGVDKKHSIRVQSGPHGLTITRGDLTFHTDKFELTKGEIVRLSVKYSPGKVKVVDDASGKLLGASTWHGWPKEAPAPAIAPFDAKQARKHQEEWASYLKVPVEHENSLGMKFVLIPPGEFMMGSAPAEIADALKFTGEDKNWQDCIKSETPKHKVILTQPIYLGVHEVTQAEYEKVMKKNPSRLAKTGPDKEWVEKVAGMDTGDHPVESLSWNDAAEFCAKLSEREKLKPFYFRSDGAVAMLAGTGYRLPTEAEWEFACRAGTTTKYWIGDKVQDLLQAAWFDTNCGGRTHAVGELKANPLGLYDVHGNACEWVQDWWEPDYYEQFQKRPTIDPSGPASAGTKRVVRGGNWFSYGSSGCRSSCRLADEWGGGHVFGFRVSLPVDAVKASIAEGKTSVVATVSWHGWPKDAPAPAIAPFDAKQARKHQAEWATYLGVPVEYENSLRMKFVLIPPGEFLMGSTPAEIEATLKLVEDKQWQDCIQGEGPQHKVILTQPIYLGVHEVTQADYAKVMDTNPSFFAKTGPLKSWVEKVAGLDTARHPVEGVSWNDAAEFCTKLSEQEKLKPCYSRSGETVTMSDGTGYRLPTEAQWEFGCRAGTTTKYWTGDKDEDLAQAGWFGTNSGARTHQAGELKANPFGLYDVHGNAWEWVQDWWSRTTYGSFQEKPALDPSGPADGSLRVIRGGDCSTDAYPCRSADHFAMEPLNRSNFIGFRAVLPVQAVKVAIAERTTASTGWHGWPKNAPAPAIAPFDTQHARKHQEEWAEYLGVPVEYENSLNMKFILIPPGEFVMGSTPEEVDELVKAWDVNDPRGPVCIKSATPQHKVILTRPMYASIHEVTQKNYEMVMGANPSVFAKSGADKQLAETVASLDTTAFPVDSVSWLDATDFCSTLSRREKLQSCYDRVENKVTLREANGYRLPSEAEWEYSCRSGTTTSYWFGDGNADLSTAGWFGAISGGRPHAVGELRANPFGLYDLHGNAGEWVQDWWEPNYHEPTKAVPVVNPQNESVSGKSERVLRGGNWRGGTWRCRSPFRDSRDYWHRHQDYGFRVWLSTDAVKAEIAKRTAKPPIASGAWHGWPADAPRAAIAPFTAEQANKHQQEWAAYLKVDVEYKNSLGMKFVLIPPGEFTMGSTPAEIEEALTFVDAREEVLKFTNGKYELWRENIKSGAPQHKVILTQPIYLGVHEVTQADYERVMGKNPSYFAQTGSDKKWVEKVAGMDTSAHPVEGVSWNDAAEFCAKLSEKEKLKAFYFRSGDTVAMLEGTGYRLPTEAQWEFACRAGTTTKYWIGDKDEDLVQAAWFGTNSASQTHRVGELKANPLGLYDIHGNVREWVQDGREPKYFEQFQDKPALNPIGPQSAGFERVFRGGPWAGPATDCRASHRNANGQAYSDTGIGFRVSLPVDAVKASLAERKSNVVSAATGSPKEAPLPANAPFDMKQARRHQEEWASYLGVPLERKIAIGGGEKMVFVLIPPGEFSMGSTKEVIDRFVAEAQAAKLDDLVERIRTEGPQHRVQISKPFYLGKYEVSQAQWEAVMGNNPSHFKGPSHPVDSVSWNAVQPLLEKLNRDTDTAGIKFVLPTEAQWEYAARGGRTWIWHSGNNNDDELPAYDWVNSNSGGQTHPIGLLKPNPWGLFDLQGNVQEWCQDFFRFDYYSSTYHPNKICQDPAGPPTGEKRVHRGGSANWDAWMCRRAFRQFDSPESVRAFGGVRLALAFDSASGATNGNFALGFRDAGEKLEFPDLKIPAGGPWTAEAWVTPRDPLPKDWATSSLVFRVSEAALVLKHAGQGGIKWSAGGPSTKPPPSINSAKSVETNKHVHVALTRGPEGVSFYLNGELQGEPLAIISGKEATLHLCEPDPMWHKIPFQGEIDELRISSVVRYREKFTPKPRFEPDADTLALYHCDEGQGTELKDASGHNRNGKINGSKWVEVEGTATKP